MKKIGLFFLLAISFSIFLNVNVNSQKSDIDLAGLIALNTVEAETSCSGGKILFSGCKSLPNSSYVCGNSAKQCQKNGREKSML